MTAPPQRLHGPAQGCYPASSSESAREMEAAITPSFSAAYVRVEGDAMRKALIGAGAVIVVALLILRFLSC
jgi:hypothetical protein